MALLKEDIANLAVLNSDEQAFSRLFEPLLQVRNTAGLEWSAQFFEKNPYFARTHNRQNRVEQYRVRLNDYLNAPALDDQDGEVVQRILDGINGNPEDNSSEQQSGS